MVWSHPDSSAAEEIQSIASQLLHSGESRAGQAAALRLKLQQSRTKLLKLRPNSRYKTRTITVRGSFTSKS